MPTLKDILKKNQGKDLEDLAGVLEDFMAARKRAQDDRLDRFVSAIEGIERIANTLSDAVAKLSTREELAPILKKHGELLAAIKDKETPQFPEVQTVHIKNLPEPSSEVSLKKPSWWKFNSSAKLERLIIGLRGDLRDLLSPKEEESEPSGSPQVAAGISMMKRDRRRRSKYDVAPKETADGIISTFTYPDNWVKGSLRIHVGGNRQSVAGGDLTEIGNRQITFTTPPPAGQQPYADYDTA